MRITPEYLLIGAMAVFAVTGGIASALYDGGEPVVTVDPLDPVAAIGPQDQARLWFQSIRRYCNPVEVQTQLRWQPPPPTTDGAMHRAACYALAGKIEQARAVIEDIPTNMRYQAAGVVFEAGHPAADAGDDIAAGPLMELVVDYWPNHYMALYHAGAARFETGSYDVAKKYLESFLAEYHTEDGWRSNAQSMLQQIEGR